jgi:hypothetical protein
MPLPTPHHTPRHYNSNVHRGVHYLSAKATTAYEDARAKVARFINAASDREVVFTRNASEAINLVAQTWGLDNLKAGDEVRGRTGGGGGGECGWEGGVWLGGIGRGRGIQAALLKQLPVSDQLCCCWCA